jgi:hypothetical protein
MKRKQAQPSSQPSKKNKSIGQGLQWEALDISSGKDFANGFDGVSGVEVVSGAEFSKLMKQIDPHHEMFTSRPEPVEKKKKKKTANRIETKTTRVDKPTARQQQPFSTEKTSGKTNEDSQLSPAELKSRTRKKVLDSSKGSEKTSSSSQPAEQPSKSSKTKQEKLKARKLKRKKKQRKAKLEEKSAQEPKSIEETTVGNASSEEWSYYDLHPNLLRAISEIGFSEPTPIQKACFHPAIRAKKDIVAAAQTGSGKTLAFGLPILNLILQSLGDTTIVNDVNYDIATATAAQKNQKKQSKSPGSESASSPASRLQALILTPTRGKDEILYAAAYISTCSIKICLFIYI